MTTGAQLATIQVQYVNQPREAHWKSGSIKDANGQYWNVPKEFLGYFTPSETCQVLFEQTGKYPTILGKGDQPFPTAPSAPQTAAQMYNKPILAPKPALPQSDLPPPILSNILASAVSAGIITKPEELTNWAYQVGQAIKAFHGEADHSPAHQARTDPGIPMDVDPGPFG